MIPQLFPQLFLLVNYSGKIKILIYVYTYNEDYKMII